MHCVRAMRLTAVFIYLNSSQLNAALHIIQWVNSAGATTVRYQGKALTDTKIIKKEKNE